MIPDNVDVDVEVNTVVGWMRLHGVRRFRSRALGIELELWPVDAIDEPKSYDPASHEALNDAPAQQIEEPGDLCGCGHHMEIEHGPLGCLMGCSTGACANPIVPVATPGPETP